MNDQDLEMLHLVKHYCKERPELISHIVLYATQGVLEANKELTQQCVDMETIAAAACSSRWGKDRLQFVKQKLANLKKSSLSWDWLLKLDK